MIERSSYSNDALDAFQVYWDELSIEAKKSGGTAGDAQLVPLRSAFNPMKLPAYLPQIFITELVSDDCILVRLAGTAIDENAGQILQGKNFLDICDPDERGLHVGVCKIMASQPCGVEMTRRARLADGRIHQFKSVSLPLADNEGVPRFVVGIADLETNMAYKVQTGRANSGRSQVLEYEFIDLGAGIPPKDREIPDLK